MPTATTIGGWVVIAGVAAGYYFMFGQRKPKNIRTAELKQSAKGTDTNKKAKKEKPSKDGGLSSGDQSAQAAQSGSKSSKKKNKAASKPPNASTTTTQEQRSEANIESVEDADDDQSPVNSPLLRATTTADSPSRSNVSDMIEKPDGAPSVLKVTAPTKSAESKKQNNHAQSDSAETKKQRQNRKKAEEKKAAREAEEKQRKVLMEKQRRTAREAEGRAAKDGSAFMAAQAPSKSAWTAPPAINGQANGKNGISPKPVELLDTYELAGKVTAKPIEEVHSEHLAQGGRLVNKYAGLTEEEQLRLVQQDSATWETVKGREKRKTKANGNGKEAKGSKDGKPSTSSARSGSDVGVAQPVQPAPTAAKLDAPVSHTGANQHTIDQSLEAEDAEWDVS